MKGPFVVACLTLALAACERTPTSAEHPPEAAVQEAAPPLFADPVLGIEIAPVEGMTLRRDLDANYFMAADEWKAFAGPDSRGTRVAALALDGSDDVTSAELRIGVSDDAQEIAACRDLPDQVDAGDRPQEASIGGVPFLRFEAGDAGMSHRLDVEGYRAVHDGRCYAIDLIVFGTSPDVYDPPRQAPFSDDDARQRLRQALQAIRLR